MKKLNDVKKGLSEKAGKLKKLVNENSDSIVVGGIAATSFVVGAIAHKVLDDALYGDIRWNNITRYDPNEEGRPECATYVQSPSIREMKNGKTDGICLITSKQEEIRKYFPKNYEE